MPAKLIIESDLEQIHQEVVFDKPRISIGRKAGNDLHFNRAEISGNHAVFLFENDEYFVSDLGSTNGTQLNGSPIVAKEKYPLHGDDIVTITPYRIIFQADQDASATMMEIPSAEVQKMRKAGSGTVYEKPPKVSTGTEEHEKNDFAKVIDRVSASAEGGEQQPTIQKTPGAAGPSPPKSAAPQKSTPAKDSAPPETTADPASPNPAAAEGTAAPAEKAPGKIRDYVWFVIGGIFVLIAIGLLLLVFMGM
jgi:pSer/pThr/pTyr-binding forkhead associated (FHA) protein